MVHGIGNTPIVYVKPHIGIKGNEKVHMIAKIGGMKSKAREISEADIRQVSKENGKPNRTNLDANL